VIWLVLALLVAGLAIVIVVAVRYDARRSELRREAWRRFASDRGFRWIEAAGPWYRRIPQAIEGTLEGVAFRLDTFTVSTGKTQVTYTRVKSQLERRFPGKLLATRRTFLTPIGEAVGWKSIRTGDRSFDDRMVVRSKASEATLRALDDEVRLRLGALARSVNLQVADREVKVWWRNAERDPQALEAGCRLVATLARACAKA
jgi:hypothetical protein